MIRTPIDDLAFRSWVAKEEAWLNRLRSNTEELASTLLRAISKSLCHRATAARRRSHALRSTIILRTTR